MTTYVVKDHWETYWTQSAGCQVKVLAWIPPLEMDWPSLSQSAQIEYLEGPHKGETAELWADNLEEVEQ